jgi:exodeoxyribonuclease VII large subunit
VQHDRPIKPTPLTHVAQLVKSLLNDELLKNIWVEATIVSLNKHSSGHWYITLKEGDVTMPASVWRSSAIRLTAPTPGSVVHLHGRIDFYPANSKVQFIIDDIRELGTDARAIELERLMVHYATLTRKRPLPAFPRRIGIATSRTGAALQDVLSTIQQRFPSVEIVLAHCAVQGASAPTEIEAALELLYAEPLDVILVVRGGGAAEDLIAFNSEIVAKAVLRAPVPVVSGVGHEVDTTLIDVVADVRAATPTYAATAVTPNRNDILQHLANLRYTMALYVANSAAEREMRLDDASARLLRAAPAMRIASMQQQLGYAQRRMQRAMTTIVQQRRAQLEHHAARIDALDPSAVLERGYAIVRTADGALIRSALGTPTGTSIGIQFADGVLPAQTTEHQS